tara:strand:- start:202 stop:399 length:198 start_codon:yes stop_codon:yes gene_type:complete
MIPQIITFESKINFNEKLNLNAKNSRRKQEKIIKLKRMENFRSTLFLKIKDKKKKNKLRRNIDKI